MTAVDVYLRPGVYFCYDAEYPQQLKGTRRLYETAVIQGNTVIRKLLKFYRNLNMSNQYYQLLLLDGF